MKRPPKQKRNLRGEPAEPAKFSRKDLLAAEMNPEDGAHFLRDQGGE